MDDKHILVLGGFGKVGMQTTRYLLNSTDAGITLASRTPQPIAQDITARYGDRIKSTQLDATSDNTALIEACAKTDLLISCIGPSGIIGDRVAKIAKKTGTPLVDAGGYDPVLHSLDEAETQSPSPVPLIINVGLLPGLSGLFPKYVIDTTAKGRQIRQLDIQYVGRDAWSYNSAWDIINGLGDFGDEKGFCYIEDNSIVQVPMRRATNKATFPAPIGTVSTMLIYAEEIVRLARQCNIKTARVFGANIGPRATFVCMLAKIFRMYKSLKSIDRAARWLVRASHKDMRKLEPAYGVQVDAHYATGSAVSGQLVLADTYQATGVTIGIAATAALEGNTAGPGVYMLHEAIDAQWFMQHLEQAGLLNVKEIRPNGELLNEGANQ